MKSESIRIVRLTALAVLAAGAVRAWEIPVSLDGSWRFHTDSAGVGEREGWHKPGFDRSGWRTVRVPHTWQVDAGTEDYLGEAWYARTVVLDDMPDDAVLRFEFDAVNRDAVVYIDGQRVFEHAGSGTTPFSFLPFGNRPEETPSSFLIAVRVDNRFSDRALPYQDSFDWPADGGLIRSARVRAVPAVHLAGLRVSATPDPASGRAELRAEAALSPAADARRFRVRFAVFGPSGDRLVSGEAPLRAGLRGASASWSASLVSPVLWHFDAPVLYRLKAELLADGAAVHETETRFGVRSVKVRDGRFILNGEPMRLMGVEWMPGSDPRHGLSEGPDHIASVLADMKSLNAVVTRFHWQQDASVFDFCDREGMLVQEEIPAWGGFRGLNAVRDVQALHTREMVDAHYNHPSLFAWGLCNEILSQDSAGHEFVQRGMGLFRSMDPTRLLTFASNRVHENPERDAAGLTDFIEWNEYYESWYGGGLNSLAESLERLARAFPGKALVVSEYGLCECAPGNPSGDGRRIEILKTHTDAYRKNRAVAGAIFFDYNDYRTHIGDKGRGAFRQRVHGVTDLLGRRKPSWEALRRELSPVRTLAIGDTVRRGGETSVAFRLVTRSLENDMPAYTLRGYTLAWTALNALDQPIESGRLILPDLPPGSDRRFTAAWPEFEGLKTLRAVLWRPTGFAVLEEERSAAPAPKP